MAVIEREGLGFRGGPVGDRKRIFGVEAVSAHRPDPIDFDQLIARLGEGESLPL